MKPEIYLPFSRPRLSIADRQKNMRTVFWAPRGMEWKINLPQRQFYLKHFYDSWCTHFTGAWSKTSHPSPGYRAVRGFPSRNEDLFPRLDVTIIDSLTKRINFLADWKLDLVEFISTMDVRRTLQDKKFSLLIWYRNCRAVARHAGTLWA